MMNTLEIQELKKVFAGAIPEEKVEYLIHLQVFLREALARNAAFSEIVRKLLEELRALARSEYGIEANTGLNLARFEDIPGFARQLSVRPPSDEEVGFLKDGIGFIDYALRNGLLFSSVIEGLAHDLLPIESHNYSLSEAAKDPLFRPLTPKYAGMEDFVEEDPAVYD